MVNFIVKVKRRYRLFEIWWCQLLLDIGASVTSGAAGNKQTSGWYEPVNCFESIRLQASYYALLEMNDIMLAITLSFLLDMWTL